MNANNELDLRVRRTYKFLWDAFMSLMTEKKFEAITVTNICERARVHRTTFYKHYEDKYGLLYHGIQEEINSLFEAIDLAGENEPDMMARLITLFEHVRSRQQFYRFMLGDNSFAKFNTLLRKSLAGRLKHLLIPNEDQIPTDLHAQLQAASMVGMVEWWLENDFPYSPTEMTEYLKVHFKLMRLNHSNV